MSKSVYLKLTSAIAVDGQIIPASKPGRPSVIEVSELEAKNLLGRGKAVLATADDGAPVADGGDGLPDFARLNKAQLLQFAADNEIQADESMTKAQILEVIESAISEAE